jgi:hypothetical protein
MQGWIKLHRKFREWGWYQNSEMVHLFLHFLLLANHKGGEWQGNKIKKGQFITGLDSLHKDTGISVQTIRTCINKLKSTSEITNKSTNKFRLITIIKWEEYQPKEEKLTSKSTGKLTNNQQTTNKQLTANKNVKKEKNVKNIPKGIKKQVSYGREDINNSIKHLKDKLNSSLDGTIKENRQYAKLLIDRFKKDYPKYNTEEQICFLIDIALKDKFHSRNTTNFKYLYYNAQKIIQTVKQKNNFTTII